MVECGLPSEIFTNRSNWDCFLEHSFYLTKDNSPAFDFDTLSIVQLKKLYEFIIENEERDIDSQIVNVLEQMLNEEKP